MNWEAPYKKHFFVNIWNSHWTKQQLCESSCLSMDRCLMRCREGDFRSLQPVINVSLTLQNSSIIGDLGSFCTFSILFPYIHWRACIQYLVYLKEAPWKHTTLRTHTVLAVATEIIAESKWEDFLKIKPYKHPNHQIHWLKHMFFEAWWFLMWWKSNKIFYKQLVYRRDLLQGILPVSHMNFVIPVPLTSA
jgi:hypothetical protein